jgi:hypothetical protein
MKRITLLLCLFFAILVNTRLIAQLLEDDEPVIFNAILEGTFDLVVTDGDNQTAHFNSAPDYNIGVSETQGVPGIDPGHSTVTMSATGNWFLKIRAEDFVPNGSGTGIIPISNLGVWCSASGTHQFGAEVNCPCPSADAALGLQNVDQDLITLGSGNAGNPDQNTFVLNWLMGTMQGTMRPESMFTQLANGVFSQGSYVTTVWLTMTEIP